MNSQGLAKEANGGAEGRDAEDGRVQEVSGDPQNDITEEYLARATRSLDAMLKAGNPHAASTAIATLSTILKVRCPSSSCRHIISLLPGLHSQIRTVH